MEEGRTEVAIPTFGDEARANLASSSFGVVAAAVASEIVARPVGSDRARRFEDSDRRRRTQPFGVEGRAV